MSTFRTQAESHDALGHGIRLAVGRAPDTRKSGAATVFMMNLKRRIALVIGVLISGFGISATPARGARSPVRSLAEDCRAILINFIRNETQSIDVGFWFMEDARYSNELIARFKAGVTGARHHGPARQRHESSSNADRSRSCRPQASRCGGARPAASCTTS